MTRLALSRRLALFLGVATPLAETVRRWGTLWDDPPAYLDDWLVGALLLAGVVATGRAVTASQRARARALLAAAWGFACGILYYSIAGHVQMLAAGAPDPAPIPSEAVLAIKLGGAVLCVTGLVLTLAAEPGPDPAEL